MPNSFVPSVPAARANAFVYRFPFSPVALAATLVTILVIAYAALMAVAMSYAALAIQFTQSVASNEAAVAQLESTYLDKLAAITNTDYAALGYAEPARRIYVPKASVTALR